MKGEAERAAAIYLQEENAWGCLVSMYKYLMEKSEEDSQWAQTEIQNIPFTLKKNSSGGSMIKHCNRLPRMVLDSLSLEILKTQLDVVLSSLLLLTLL